MKPLIAWLLLCFLDDPIPTGDGSGALSISRRQELGTRMPVVYDDLTSDESILHGGGDDAGGASLDPACAIETFEMLLTHGSTRGSHLPCHAPQAVIAQGSTVFIKFDSHRGETW
ncbi:hypothetical protein PspLS_04962 [Pyricularia sp. CBS 133598]|nr:hypothetical protein PspLS_04962 [Pyricularia sp. CBS 133598]